MTQRTARRARFFEAGALLALVALAYGNAARGPFTFDDWHVLPQNPAIQNLDNIPSFFADASAFSILVDNQDYRPVFLTAAAICWQLGDGSPRPFQILSIALHAFTVLLLAATVRATLRPVHGDSVLPDPLVRPIALAAAALFAAHPLATQAVNYISAQPEVLGALFTLLAFYGFLRAQSATGSSARTGWMLLSMASFLVALLSKPTAIVLPGLLLLWEVVVRGAGHEPRAVVKRLRAHVGYWLLAAGYLALRSLVTQQAYVVERTPWDRWTWTLTQTEALVSHYLRLTLWPSDLNVDRHYEVVRSVRDPGLLLSLAVLVGLAVVLSRWYARSRILVFWALWFPAGLFLTSYVVILIQVVNEHRVYLSLAGACAVAAIGAGLFLSRLPLHWSDSVLGIRTGRWASVSLLAILLSAATLQTRARNEVWADSLELWADAARGDGTWRAHMNYALELEDAQRPDEALAEFERAVELGPYAFAYLNLGMAQIRRGLHGEGIAHLRKAVSLWSTNPETHFYLAVGLQKTGELAEAERELRQAIELRPNYVKARERLAALLERQDRLREAEAELLALAELLPQDSDLKRRLEALRGRSVIEPGSPAAAWDALADGRLQEALEAFRELAKSHPEDAKLVFGHAYAAQKAGESEESRQRYEYLLSLQPDHVRGLFNLGYEYLKNGSGPADWERAAQLFSRVRQLSPDYSEATFRLASALWKLGREEEAREADRLYLETEPHPDLEPISRRRIGEEVDSR